MGKVILLDNYRKTPPCHCTPAQEALLALNKHFASVAECLMSAAPRNRLRRGCFFARMYFGDRGAEAYLRCCGSRVFMGKRLAREFKQNYYPLGSWGEFGRWIILDNVPYDSDLLGQVIEYFFADEPPDGDCA